MRLKTDVCNRCQVPDLNFQLFQRSLSVDTKKLTSNGLPPIRAFPFKALMI